MFVEENRPENNNNDVTEKEHIPSDSYNFTPSDDNKREDLTETITTDEITAVRDDNHNESEKAESSFEVSEKSVPNHGDGTFYSRNADGVPANGYEWDESNEKLIINYENCMECGACRIACKHIQWEYPKGTKGIMYKLG